MTLAGRRELAPGGARLDPPAQLLLAAEPVQHFELIRGPCEPPLLELARHRQHALDGGGDVLAGGGAAPRVRAGAAVAEDLAGDDERVLVLRAQLAELVELVGQVELGLDVRLLAGRADERRVALRPEQQPHRLGQDRLPGAGLAGDRVQAGRQLELGLPDQDEVLDSQAAQHRCPS